VNMVWFVLVGVVVESHLHFTVVTYCLGTGRIWLGAWLDEACWPGCKTGLRLTGLCMCWDRPRESWVGVVVGRAWCALTGDL